MLILTFRLIVIFGLLAETTFTKIILKTPPNDHLLLSECALNVTERYICPISKTLLFMEHCQNCTVKLKNYQRRFFNHYLKHFVPCTSVQYVMDADEQPWNYYIFVVNNVQAFNKVLNDFSENMHEREFYFLIVLTDKTVSETKRADNMLQIFESCFKFNVLNALIMVEQPDGSISFHTYILFKPDCTRRLSTVLANHYQSGVYLHDQLFPARLRNFHGCKLNISGYLLPPLLTFLGDFKRREHLNEIERLSGIEGDILKLVADALHFRINLKLFKEKKINEGDFGGLHFGGADIAIGGLSASDERRFMFTVSATYHHNPFVFVVCSGLHFGPIRQLANSFRGKVWCCITLTLFIALRVIKILNDHIDASLRAFVLGTRNTSPRTNLWTILLGNPISRLPRRNFARFLLMTWMLATFVLRSAYQGKMYDALRVSQRVPIPRDINELIEKKYFLYTSSMYDFYPENLTYVVNMNFTERFRTLEQLRGKYVALSLLDNLAHHNRLHSTTSTLTHVKEPIYLYQQVMYFRKHSVLKKAFDHKLKQLMSSGITAHIAKKHVKQKFLSINAGKQLVRQINLTKLRGLYMIYVAMMGVAVLCFAMELITQRTGRFQWLGRYLRAAHKVGY